MLAALAFVLPLLAPAAARAFSAPVITAPAGGTLTASSTVHVTWSEDDPANTASFDIFVSQDSCDTSGGSVDNVPSDGTSTDYAADVDLGSSDGSFCITVQANPTSGDPLSSSVSPIVLDTTAPSPPGSVQVTSRTDEFPQLSWGPGNGDGGGSGIVSYTVYRENVPVNAQPVGDGTRRSYTDTSVAPGTYHYAVTVTDRAGNESSKAPVTITYDGPSATIGTHPGNPSANPRPTFSFGGSSAAQSFRCSLDGSAPAACSSPARVNVTPGSHTFSVIAVDQNGNTGDPDSYTWRYAPNGDTTPPSATVTSVSIGHGAVPVTAVVSDASGISEVVFQYIIAGATQWTTFADVTSVTGNSVPATWLTGGPVVDGSYALRVIATDGAGNSAASTPFQIVVDNAPPSTPGTPVAAASPTRTAPTITWPANAGSDVLGYDVYRAGVLVTRVAGTSFTDTLPGNGAADGAYPYTIRAIDKAQNQSGPSAPATVIYDTTPPVVPASVTATTSGSTVTVSWPATADPSRGGVASGVAGYVVRRAAGTTAPASSAAGDPVCAVGATAASCTDTGRTVGQTLSYAVFAVDAAGNVSAGKPVSVVVGKTTTGALPDKTPPGKVLKLKLTVKASRATLTWANPKAPDLDHVQVVRNAKRKPRSPSDGTRVYRGKGTHATFLGKAGTTMHVAVFAVDHAGNVSPGAFTDARFARALLEPLAGTRLTGSPKLSWKPVKGAAYYNVQVFRILGRKRVAISWPHGTTYTVPAGKLTKGKSYVWYVWPGFGKLADAHYGKLIGHSTFSYH